MPTYETGKFQLDYSGAFPDQLKLIKTITAYPLEFTATGSLNPRNQKWNYTIGCRDVVLNGKLIINARRGAIEYRKVLPLPIFGGVTKPVIAAEWQIGSVRDDWRNWSRPRLQLGFAVDDSPSTTDDGWNVNTNGSVSFRKKAYLTKRWGLEVDGTARFNLQHDVTGRGNVGSSLGLALNAKELNVVCRV